MNAKEAEALVQQSKSEWDNANVIKEREELYAIIKKACLERKESVSGGWYKHGTLPFIEELRNNGYYVYHYYSGGGYSWRICWGSDAEKEFKREREREIADKQEPFKQKKKWWSF